MICDAVSIRVDHVAPIEYSHEDVRVATERVIVCKPHERRAAAFRVALARAATVVGAVHLARRAHHFDILRHYDQDAF